MLPSTMVDLYTVGTLPYPTEPPWRPCQYKGIGGSSPYSPRSMGHRLICRYQCGKYQVALFINGNRAEDFRDLKIYKRAIRLARRRPQMSARASRLNRSRWFGSVRISRDGRLRFSAQTFNSLGHVAIWEKGPHSVDVLVGGLQVLFLYLHESRVVSACFVYTLSPIELREAVKTLRGVPGGLASWIVPALEWTQSTPTMVRPDLIAAIPEVLESCRDLPVAEIWRRRRRQIQQEWAECLRTHPERLSEVRAPWMLPEGYKLSLATKKASR